MGLRKTEEAGIDACAIARDVQAFELLIEDMETELGERWGGLDFTDGIAYLATPEAAALEFITVAVDRKDEENLEPVTDLIRVAAQRGVKVILVAHDLTPMALHELLRLGADDFAPYPLPEGALHEAILRLRQKSMMSAQAVTDGGSGARRNGVMVPVYGLAGGVGATTFAVNLAWELATEASQQGLKTCILDLDLQTGSVSTYLDLPRREAIFELLSDTPAMDNDSFSQAMLPFNDKLDVLTAPADALPLELLTPEDVDTILDTALSLYDYVIIDMPTTLVHWTETILQRADIYFAIMEMDMRSAQNALRFIRTLKAEDLPLEKVKFALNRAPKFTDISARSRVKRMAENLNIDLELLLSDGGKQVVNACDHGLPLSDSAPKNPLRKEYMKLAGTILELSTSAVSSLRKG
ncbi:MAG: AAA family ATPase [Alphaproteobacteria bacterium]|nr:AAA family ATPase [Alphaproteobacteria bacterium]